MMLNMLRGIVNTSCRLLRLRPFAAAAAIETKPCFADTTKPAPMLMESQIRTYKAKVRLRRRCKSCYFMWRNGRLYVECEAEPRHKQFHKNSMLKGFDNIPFGYDVKAEKLLKQQQQQSSSSSTTTNSPQ